MPDISLKKENNSSKILTYLPQNFEINQLLKNNPFLKQIGEIHNNIPNNLIPLESDFYEENVKYDTKLYLDQQKTKKYQKREMQKRYKQDLEEQMKEKQEKNNENELNEMEIEKNLFNDIVNTSNKDLKSIEYSKDLDSIMKEKIIKKILDYNNEKKQEKEFGK